VSTVSLEIVAIVNPGNGSTHDVFLGFENLKGQASYAGLRYSSTAPYGTAVASISGTFDPGGSTTSSKNVRLFADTRNDDWGKEGARVTLTFALSNPTSNPLSLFDKVPFDTWIYNISTSHNVYIYDLETGHHFDDVAAVQATHPNVNPYNDQRLLGIPVNCGLINPDVNWSPQNTEQHPMWWYYQDFIEFAKTARSGVVKNRNWYSNYNSAGQPRQ